MLVMKKYIWLVVLMIIFAFAIGVRIINKDNPKVLLDVSIKNKDENKNDTKNVIKSVKISAAGDCTLGWDPRYGYATRFDKYLDDNNGDFGYYFKKVKDVFEKDDLTIVNLEGQFTTSNDKVEKKYNFKGPTSYVNILKEGSVEAVSFANNHARDFGEKGYNETIETLKNAGVLYYGDSNYLIKEINGIKIGFFAFLDIYGQKYSLVKDAIDYLKENNCDLIIASMHWGIEGDYKQATFQEKMGRYMIDNGVDLVLGSHPHRIQGIEKYKGKYIVYSMANFSFGGNQNPPDKDTFIFQQTFNFIDGEIALDDSIKIIPASVSGVKNVNNYQPVILEGEEKERVFNKIMKYSSGFDYELN